jgi:hypothetical protein
MRPDKYTFKLNEQWKFIEKLEEPTEIDKEKYEMCMDVEGDRIQVEWFSTSNGLRIETPKRVSEEKSKEYGIFGLVCMRLILTGNNWMKEL